MRASASLQKKHNVLELFHYLSSHVMTDIDDAWSDLLIVPP